MNFQQVIVYEGAHEGSYFKRTDSDAQWLIHFDPQRAGRLVMTSIAKTHFVEIELYHHDFMDGEWEVVA